MITETFDIKTKALFGPETFCRIHEQKCELCIVTFSKKIEQGVLKTFDCEVIAEVFALNGPITTYMFEYKGKKIAFYMSPIGSAVSVMNLLEVSYMTGATKFVMFGSAGSLDPEKTTGKYVVPTESYRDEGISYHYAHASDYIDVPGSAKVAEIFEELSLPYVCGRTWTTDAFFRETEGNIAKRKADGCIAVDMELSGVQAACTFSGLELYDFLVTGDVLGAGTYTRGTLDRVNHDIDNFYTALEIAVRI